MAFQVLMAGQDITAYVQEKSIKLSSTLGQGAGTGGGAGGRAATLTFLCSLGPAASAQFPTSVPMVGGPYLVRQGEIKVFDALGQQIFGGYATKIDDKTVLTRVYTEVSCHDYWQDLDRIIINEVYNGQTDIFIIKDLLTKYAPWIDQSLLPSTATFVFGVRNFQHWTLQNALQNIVDGVGYQFWITYDKKAHYVNPNATSTAPFQVSDAPDQTVSFPLNVTDFSVDDTAIVNRVYFYGGKHLSQDITQDLSNQVDGNNDILTLAWYPHKAADGAYHIIKNSVEQTFGFVGGTGAANVLIRDGGTAQILLDIDAHNIQFNTAPTAGTSVKFKGRHEIPLVVILQDNASYTAFGRYYDGVISDQSVFETSTAIQRCRVLLLQQNFGLVSLKLQCWKPGIQVGQTLRVDHNKRNIHNSYIVQQVDVVPLGAGHFRYDIQLGAWNWNLVDLLHLIAEAATPTDEASDSSTVATQVKQLSETIHTADAISRTTRTYPYLFRTSVVGDGQDGFFGLSRF